MISERDLVARCRAGEGDAWRALVEHFSRYVYAICTRGFRLSSTDAEDVFQEVFARTYQHLEKLRDDDAIRPWLGQLTRRLCIDCLRRRSREQLADGALEPEDIDARLDELWPSRASSPARPPGRAPASPRHRTALARKTGEKGSGHGRFPSSVAVSRSARSTYTAFTPLLPVTDATFLLTLSLDMRALGANKRIHAATCLENSIELVVTADAAFDHVSGLRRIDPLDEPALWGLLAEA